MPTITRAELMLIVAECVRIREAITDLTQRNGSASALGAQILPRVAEIERQIDDVNKAAD